MIDMWMPGGLCTTGPMRSVQTQSCRGLALLRGEAMVARRIQQAQRGYPAAIWPAKPAGCVDQLDAGRPRVVARLLADAHWRPPP